MVKDYFLFKRMLIPFLVQILFWLGIITTTVTGVLDLTHGAWIQGILTIILGPVLVRMACEIMIVLFEINDTLTDIKEYIQEKGK